MKRILAALIPATMVPAFVLAQVAGPERAFQIAFESGTWDFFLLLALLLAAGAILAVVWVGILNHALLHHATLSSESGKPYLPRTKTVIATVSGTALLYALSFKVLKGVAPFDALPTPMLFWAFVAFALIASLLELKWLWMRDEVFAVVIGTAVSFILLAFNDLVRGSSGIGANPFLMALAMVCAVVLWRFLFGPWSPRIKATVLSTFLLWIALHILSLEGSQARLTHLMAAIIALVPAVLWCWLFLEYHRQRLSLVFLMFCAGMLSTAPILFYDLLVRRGIEFQFFLFKVVPQNFNAITDSFVTGIGQALIPAHTTLLSTLISFLLVGLIEETSKFWVLKQSGRRFFQSVDDVIQLAIIVAIGFAFAENILNPTYFTGFVKEFLVDPATPQWGIFLANITGRSILTAMVHIVSSGVGGYFLGLAIFARPCLEEEHALGEVHLVADSLHWLLRVPEKTVYAVQTITLGILFPTLLHGLFNFMVTLPDILPGHPKTIGNLLGLDVWGLKDISLLMLPSLLYVVGGFWLFSILFYRKENRTERGRLVTTDAFVTGSALP
ncbi:MAG: PrsW family glutamic-type intramembrane protease [Candidatus Peregrinibacteria bacterium]